MTVERTGILLLLTLGLASLSQGVQAAGDPERGKTLFAACELCHGSKAEGLAEMNAPGLAGREAWYLRRQIENFKSGARGGDARDTYGRQMAPMAQMLQDQQAIEDVLAYLDTLE